MSTDTIIRNDRGTDKASGYRWINIEVDDIRVGKARLSVSGKRLTINSVIIFPEFERRGYAGKVMDLFKEDYEEIVADRVRTEARGFWEKMGFHRDGYGNYIWKSGQQ